jgi:hypothetical protein
VSRAGAVGRADADDLDALGLGINSGRGSSELVIVAFAYSEPDQAS